MRPNDLLRDEQAQTEAGACSAAISVRCAATERVEEMWDQLRGNRLAFIVDFDDDVRHQQPTLIR